MTLSRNTIPRLPQPWSPGLASGTSRPRRVVLGGEEGRVLRVNLYFPYFMVSQPLTQLVSSNET